jgi:hypothetical protein
MRLHSLAALAGCALLAACPEARPREAGEAPRAPRPDLLAAVPVFSPATLTDTSGTDETEQRVFLAPTSPELVAFFYRIRLPESGWRIIADHNERGVRSLHADRPDGRLLWITARSVSRGSTEFILLGGLPGVAPAPERAR